MTRAEYLSAWSLAHGFEDGNEIAGIARAYLSLNYYLVQPFILLRFTPNLVTLLAPLLAATALVVDEKLQIALLILASLMVDGFDGAVAIIRKKMTPAGGVWDGIIDRVTELLWIGALYYGGISPALLLVIWVIVATQEYGRAKLNHVVGNVLGTVTICERPVRGLLVAFGFLGEILYSPCLEVVALVWLVLQAIALLQFSVMARRQLR
jgi:CDP-diacylglycerol--glycerol-3-phosphate 3-phosphatidyltransferase